MGLHENAQCLRNELLTNSIIVQILFLLMFIFRFILCMNVQEWNMNTSCECKMVLYFQSQPLVSLLTQALKNMIYLTKCIATRLSLTLPLTMKNITCDWYVKCSSHKLHSCKFEPWNMMWYHNSLHYLHTLPIHHPSVPVFVRILAKSHHLPQQDPITPYITGSRKFKIGNSFWSSPSNWNLATLDK